MGIVEKDFYKRVEQHDKKALPLVNIVFKKHGFLLFPFGGELEPELQRTLDKLRNETGQMLRYRPDSVAVNSENGIVLLLEIKSKESNSPNFAVEIDAWNALNLWNQDVRRVLCVFVDVLVMEVLARWPDELSPRKIFVPRADDIQRLKAQFPPSSITYLPNVRDGSKTAFFLVPKSELSPVDVMLTDLRLAIII